MRRFALAIGCLALYCVALFLAPISDAAYVVGVLVPALVVLVGGIWLTRDESD